MQSATDMKPIPQFILENKKSLGPEFQPHAENLLKLWKWKSTRKRIPSFLRRVKKKNTFFFLSSLWALIQTHTKKLIKLCKRNSKPNWFPSFSSKKRVLLVSMESEFNARTNKQKIYMNPIPFILAREKKKQPPWDLKSNLVQKRVFKTKVNKMHAAVYTECESQRASVSWFSPCPRF